MEDIWLSVSVNSNNWDQQFFRNTAIVSGLNGIAVAQTQFNLTAYVRREVESAIAAYEKAKGEG